MRIRTFGFGVVISAALARLIGGNIIAGFVGGASLTFFWPLLFYLNMRTGGLFVRPPLVIDDRDHQRRFVVRAGGRLELL